MTTSKTAVLSSLCAVIDRFAEVWSDNMLADDLAERLNCAEVDALSALLRVAGQAKAAGTWKARHAAKDEEGDTHYVPDEVENPAPGGCHYSFIDTNTFGIDLDKMCESHTSDLIRSISDQKGIVLQMFRSEDLYRHCSETLDGIPIEYHEMVIRETKDRMGWVEDHFDDWERIESIIQNVAAAHRLPTE